MNYSKHKWSHDLNPPKNDSKSRVTSAGRCRGKPKSTPERCSLEPVLLVPRSNPSSALRRLRLPDFSRTARAAPSLCGKDFFPSSSCPSFVLLSSFLVFMVHPRIGSGPPLLASWLLDLLFCCGLGFFPATGLFGFLFIIICPISLLHLILHLVLGSCFLSFL